MLDFSQNIVEETKSPFIKFLHNIESLNLSDCSLTSSDIGDLARSCGELKKPVEVDLVIRSPFVVFVFALCICSS